MLFKTFATFNKIQEIPFNIRKIKGEYLTVFSGLLKLKISLIKIFKTHNHTFLSGLF